MRCSNVNLYGFRPWGTYCLEDRWNTHKLIIIHIISDKCHNKITDKEFSMYKLPFSNLLSHNFWISCLLNLVIYLDFIYFYKEFYPLVLTKYFSTFTKAYRATEGSRVTAWNTTFNMWDNAGICIEEDFNQKWQS